MPDARRVTACHTTMALRHDVRAPMLPAAISAYALRACQGRALRCRAMPLLMPRCDTRGILRHAAEFHICLRVVFRRRVSQYAMPVLHCSMMMKEQPL